MTPLKERMLEEVNDIIMLAAQHRYRIGMYYALSPHSDIESIASHLRRMRACANIKHRLNHFWIDRYSADERHQISTGSFTTDRGWGMDTPGQLSKTWEPMSGEMIYIAIHRQLFSKRFPMRIKRGPGKGHIKMQMVKLNTPIIEGIKKCVN